MISYLKPYIVLLIVLLHCAVCSTEAGAATDSLLKSVHFDIDNGLPTNNVYSCIQDHNGYIWMVTDNGVVKYNGYSFKILTIKDGLPKNDVWRLYEDTKGRIWVFTYAYTFGYIKNDKYVPVISGKIKFKQLSILEINNLIIYTDGIDMDIVDSNDVVFRLRLKDAGAVVYRLGEDTTLVATDYTSYSKVYDLKKLTSKENGYCKIDVTTIKNLYGTSRVTSDNKEIGIGTMPGNCLYIFNHKNCKSYKVAFKKNEKLTMVCERNDVRGNKGFYVFTDKNMYTLDKKFRIVSFLPYSQISNEKIKVSYLFVDSFKSKWISTSNSGVFYTPRTFFFQNKPLVSEELKDARYVGHTYNGYTYWWDNLNSKLCIADSDMNIFYKKEMPDEVFTVSDDNSKQANITLAYHVYKLQYKNKMLIDELSGKHFTVWEFGQYESHKKWLVNHSGYELSFILANMEIVHQYDSNTLLMAGTTGLYEVEMEGSHIKLNRVTIDKYNSYFFDKNTGYDWFYNDGSIFLVNPKISKHILLSADILKSIGITHLSSIKEDSFGNVYLLTSNGLIVFNELGPTIKYIRLHMNLEDVRMEVYGNTIFLAGRFGVAYAAVKNGQLPIFKLFSNPSSLYYKHIYDFAINTKGKVILHTDKGIYVSDVYQLITSKKYYNERKMDFMNLIVHSRDKIYSGDKDTIIINQDESRITFDLINFYGKGKPSYTYRIGHDNWQTTSSGEFLYNWEPGKYYRVQCVAADDLWKSRRYTFYIIQAPYWWQTTTWKRIFWAGGILLLIGLGIITALVTRYYVRRKSEKKQALTDMELRALYAQINPHFIFNTLGTAQFFINRKKMDEAYNHVNKFARLLRAYLKASSSRYVNLGEEISLLKDYIELQQIRFEQKFDYRIEVDNKIAKDSMQVPSLLLQPLVENAINHGLFHLPEGSKGMLEIRFEQGRNSEELVCYIEDNGVGRERSKTLKKDSTIEKDKSYGTTLTKKLIDIFKEYEKMDIYLEYVDKPAPETGTIVKLTIGNVKYVA